MNKCIVLLLAWSVSSHAVAANWLFKNGKSEYTIVVAKDASMAEKSSAKELQEYIRKISGATLPLTEQLDKPGKHIYVGYNAQVAALTGVSRPSDDDESFTYQTVGEDLMIYGGSKFGTSYGIYSFLEQQLGVCWYSRDYTKIVKRKKFQLATLNRHEAPAFAYRHVMYYQLDRDFMLNLHNLTNTHQCGLSHPAYGALYAFWGIHSFERLVPASEYFKSHPEYFSVYKGKRIPDGQLCLSNPKVVELLTQSVERAIKENPEYSLFSVTQNDNEKPCECSSCQQLANKYQAQSGVMLWAVNQVAEAIEKKYPDKKIVTMAYEYTRKAPVGIKPRSNVLIRLCDIECCFAHPLEGTAENESFMKDLADWGKISDNIFLWDYVVSFHQYVAPFPNFNVLAANLRAFKANHVSAVMEEGQYESDGGEFAELKQWVLAKLAWNPYQDAHALARQFIKDYYGSAAPAVQQYFDMYCRLVTDNTHLHFNTEYDNPIFTDSFMKEGARLMEQAAYLSRKHVEESKRVEQLSAQIMYLEWKKNPLKATQDGTLKRFLKMVQRDHIFVKEATPPEKYIYEQGGI